MATRHRVALVAAALLVAAGAVAWVLAPSSADCGCNVDSANQVVARAGLQPGVVPGPVAAALPGRAR